MTIDKPQVEHDIIAIAAALGDSHGIGYRQDLPWSIPGDWEWFQRITTKPYKHLQQQQQQGGISTDIIDNLLTTIEPYQFEKDSDWHNVVIMGRLSWESIPMKQRPHHNRYNIVVSTQTTYNVHAVERWEHATLVNSIQEALTLAIQLKKTQGRIFVLGGEQIYRQLIELDTPHCTHILLTHVHHQPTPNDDNKIECDTFFPTIDPTRYRTASHQELQHFVQEIVPAGLQTHDPFQYEFRLYVRQ
ncbi:dihydrofolate reductase-like domain-containing protein [Chlamydoabsidia padenii]|nr:dihydrofolate reductase-like domain-containing protein [Chlamydoabsidia padenii]